MSERNSTARVPAGAGLRIAYLLESTQLCGVVRVVKEQAEALARLGHRVALVCPRPKEAWLSLSRAHFEFASFRESRELAQADVRVATIWTTVAPALENARGAVFHLCQGYEGDFFSYWSLRSQIQAAYALPTHKLTITQVLAQKLCDNGFGPATFVGQVFDPEPFEVLAGKGEKGQSIPTVLLVGPFGIDPVKGIEVAFEGLRLWRERGGRFRLSRVSVGPPASEERETGLVDEYHQRLDPMRMPLAYRAADLFIGPSRPEEGFGLPVLEALASGLPCVLSDTPTHREIAGDAAWYFADGEPTALAAALALAAAPQARERARVAGPVAAARFDTADVARRLEAAFRERLPERSDGGVSASVTGTGEGQALV